MNQIEETLYTLTDDADSLASELFSIDRQLGGAQFIMAYLLQQGQQGVCNSGLSSFSKMSRLMMR